MNKYISVREAYDWISIGEGQDKLTETECDELMRYLKNTANVSDKFIQMDYKKFRFINYVGILKVGKVTIEILPKLSLSDDRNYDKKILLQMLSKCTDLELNLDEAIYSKIQNYNLLELIAERYVNSLLKELNRGVHFEYKNEEENLNVMKGKLLFNEHIKRNYANKAKVFCSYNEYSSDNLLNQLLKVACIRILNNIYDFQIINKTKKVLSDLGEVSQRNISKEVVEGIVLNRHNKRFSNCLELAKFIIFNLASESTSGNEKGFTMLFEMNTLYEQYIGKLIKVLWSGEGKAVTLQDRSKYLLVDTETKKNKFNLVPDILLREKGVDKLIIDTKWKAVEYDGKVSCTTEDIYQMYAYATTYREVNKVILLYPCLTAGNEYPTWELTSYKDKLIEVRTVRLDKYTNTMDDLKNIILLEEN